MSDSLDDSLSKLWRAADHNDPVQEYRARTEIFEQLFEHPFAPARVERYVLLDRLGEGGSGKVYRAFDPELRRHVAIKLLRATSDVDGTSEERLLREAQLVAHLSHPNIVAVHDLGRLPLDAPLHAGAIFVVMELVEGLSLDRWAKTATQPWRRVVELFEAAALGVRAAHSKGVVHRDLKPSNMLVGQDGRLRVLDFGLARASNRSLGGTATETDSDSSRGESAASLLHTTLTREGAVLGTPAFMAPEQHDAQPATAQSDQFSLCATFWAVLFGQLPFEGESLAELARVKLAGPPDSPRNRRAPKWFVEVLLRGLQPKAADRFPGIDELITQLQKKRRRSRWRAPLAVIAIGGLATVSGWGWHERSMVQGCEAEAAEIDEVWNEGVRGALRERLAARPLEPAMTKLLDSDEGFAGRAIAWKQVRAAVCEEHRRGALSEKASRGQRRCLDSQQIMLKVYAELLFGSESQRPRSERLLISLPDPTQCRDPLVFESYASRALEDGDALEEITRTTARAIAYSVAGREAEAVAAGEAGIRTQRSE